MINKPQLKDLIKRTLTEYQLFSENALELIYGTIQCESNGGQYLRQVTEYFVIEKHALGVCQMEKTTFEWLREKYANKDMRIGECNFEELEYNLELSILYCRLRYLAVSKPLPDKNDIQGLAEYWKKYYNTKFGAGKIENFISKF